MSSAPIDSTRDGGVLGHKIAVGDRVRIYPGGRYATIAYIGTTDTTTVVGVTDLLTGKTPPIEEHDPRNLRKVFLPDPALAPYDRIRWTADNGTVRTGTVVSWAEDSGTWFVDIDADQTLRSRGYRTWFRPADLVRVEPDGGR